MVVDSGWSVHRYRTIEQRTTEKRATEQRKIEYTTTMASSTRIGVTLDDNEASETMNFSDLYELDQRLRSGSYGTVYVTKHRESGEEFAVKVIDRR